MDMIMSVPPANGRPKTIHNRANSTLIPSTMESASIDITGTEIYNENQVLAELIQKQALGSHKHRATLSVNRLMRSIPKATKKAITTQK